MHEYGGAATLTQGRRLANKHRTSPALSRVHHSLASETHWPETRLNMRSHPCGAPNASKSRCMGAPHLGHRLRPWWTPLLKWRPCDACPRTVASAKPTTLSGDLVNDPSVHHKTDECHWHGAPSKPRIVGASIATPTNICTHTHTQVRTNERGTWRDSRCQIPQMTSKVNRS